MEDSLKQEIRTKVTFPLIYFWNWYRGTFNWCISVCSSHGQSNPKDFTINKHEFMGVGGLLTKGIPPRVVYTHVGRHASTRVWSGGLCLTLYSD